MVVLCHVVDCRHDLLNDVQWPVAVRCLQRCGVFFRAMHRPWCSDGSTQPAVRVRRCSSIAHNVGQAEKCRSKLAYGRQLYVSGCELVLIYKLGCEPALNYKLVGKS